jgi:hypothetical protein
MAFTGNYMCDSYKTALLTGGVDFSTDVIKIALYTNAATLNASTDGYTSEGEIVVAGYTSGGSVLTPVLGGSDGVRYVNFSNVSWNMAGTARGALVYKDTGPAICVLDFGADKTSVSVFEVQFPVAGNVSSLIRIY